MKLEFKNKNIGIYGIGISGLSTVKALNRLGANLTLIDSKRAKDLEEVLSRIEDVDYVSIFGNDKLEISHLDLLVKSPGIPLNTDVLKKARNLNIKIVTDLELAYLISKNKNMILVTGTNGKTTTTTLLGEIFKKANKKVHLAGNIGKGIMDLIFQSNQEDVFIIEASSFQLESTKEFKPKISLFINISPDHLDWHGNFEDYFKSKKKAFINQNKNDWSILNYDNDLIRDLSKELNSKIIFFSTKEELEEGIYLKENKIYIKFNNKIEKIIDIEEKGIITENLLAAIGVSYAYGLDMSIVEKVIKEFSPLEHRMEFVKNIKGIDFYNDSKGTNPESTIKALQSIKGSKILIAGGYDKGSEFGELIKEVLLETKDLIIMGETKDKIMKEAKKQGFNNTFEVKTMREAVEKAFSLAEVHDKIILSPACASWGMYKNFEERGKDFKKQVKNIKVD